MTDPSLTSSLPHFLTSPRPVIFWDFEGTLAIREGRWPGALADVLERRGFTVGRDALAPLLSTGFPWRHPETPHPELSDPEAWWAHMHPIFVRIYREAGVALPLAEAASEEVRASYLSFDRWLVYPDTVPALTALTQAGWRHILLSNHVPELPQIVGAIGLGHFFAEVISSAWAGYEKPHPQIYQLALDRAGWPHTCWMIGDKVREDVLAPEEAGIPGILVRRKDRAAPRSFVHLDDLVPYLLTS